MFVQGVMATARGRRQLQKGVKYGRVIIAAGLLLTLISPSAVYSQVAATSDSQAPTAEGNTSDVASKIAPVEVDRASSVSNGTATASDTSTTQTPEAAKAHASRRRRKAKRAPVRQPVPAAATPEPTPSPPQTDGGDGGAIAVMVLVAIIFIGVMSSRTSKSRHQSVAVPKRAPAIATAPRSWAAPKPLPTPTPTAQRFTPPKPVAVWQPPGAPTTAAGYVVPDGMIYLGKATPYQSDGSGCVVDPSLSVSAPSPGSAADNLGYWPSYANISPTCRGTYLRWLATGKCDPQTYIGYVFLYFYGLERRLLTDQPPPDEVEALIAEVVRLRGIYSVNGSFNGYSRRLIETVEMVRAIADPASARPYTPDLLLPAGAMPLPLKIAIARKVVAGEPLGFELAAAGLMGLPCDVASRNTIVVDRARAVFLRSLRTQFDKAFPLGFKLRDHKDSRLRLDYQPASSGLRVNLSAGATLERLPDPATLTWTKLVNLAAEVSSELEPYAKMLAYHPERADSLAALAVCPPHLVANTAVKAQAWLAGLSAPIAVTSFADLARHAIGAKNTKWTLRHHRLVAEVLANIGRGLEPDPRDGTERLEDATEVLVISDTGCIAPSSPDFGGAAAAAVWVAAVARARGVGAESVEQAWLDQIHSRLNLTSGEILRLRARLIWLRKSNAGLAKAERLLSGATAEQRETVAWSAAIAAAAGSTVGKPEVVTLENIYDKLEAPRTAVAATEPERWPGLSGQGLPLVKWFLCRLCFAVLGSSRREGVA